MDSNDLEVYVMTWRNELRTPEVFLTLEDAQEFAAKEDVDRAAWNAIDADVWQNGDWFIDARPVSGSGWLLLALYAYAEKTNWSDYGKVALRVWEGGEDGPQLAKRALKACFLPRAENGGMKWTG